MEFPRHLHKPDGLFVIVENDAQYDAVKAAGWTDQPPGAVEKPVEVRYVDAITTGEAAAVTKTEPKKRGPKARG